jgi:hypothetical protein
MLRQATWVGGRVGWGVSDVLGAPGRALGRAQGWVAGDMVGAPTTLCLGAGRGGGRGRREALCRGRWTGSTLDGDWLRRARWEWGGQVGGEGAVASGAPTSCRRPTANCRPCPTRPTAQPPNHPTTQPRSAVELTLAGGYQAEDGGEKGRALGREGHRAKGQQRCAHMRSRRVNPLEARNPKPAGQKPARPGIRSPKRPFHRRFDKPS